MQSACYLRHLSSIVQLDHIVIGDGVFASLKERGLI